MLPGYPLAVGIDALQALAVALAQELRAALRDPDVAGELRELIRPVLPRPRSQIDHDRPPT